MNLKVPEETLMKIGFKTLDLMYGELTIEEGMGWDELFVDKGGNERFGYDKPGRQRWSLLGYLYKDREFFLTIIPIEFVDYPTVLRAWFKERYKRKVDVVTILGI